MKEVIQNYRTGTLEVVEVPAPKIRPGTILVRNICSAVSSGTERMVMDLARKSLVGKALSRPDLVRRVFDKFSADGFLETLQQVSYRLDEPVSLGYSSAGKVIEAAEAVSEFRVGELVACGGQGVATHSDVVRVPRTLAVRVPTGVSPAEAAFGMVGAIALHAVRLAHVAPGEFVAVIGLGLIGLLAGQILKASGCRVIGVDISAEKANMARALGADWAASTTAQDPAGLVHGVTGGRGVDAVIIAAATPSNEPIELAARLCRMKGRIVATGFVGLSIPRQLFYEKELEFVVSRSSGPGLYDRDYEGAGRDYPYDYVRWTHARNMSEFLRMVGRGQVRIEPLITHRFKVESALEAYSVLSRSCSTPCVAVLLEYPEAARIDSPRVEMLHEPRRSTKNTLCLGVIGAGLFARTTLLPELRRLRGIELRAVATASGISARHVARKFGAAYAATDAGEIMNDPEVDCVLVLTRHDLHAPLVVAALAAGKDVFVEKPLALTVGELQEIICTWRDSPGRLLVGFNRRHSPHALAARGFLAARSAPAVIAARVNAGRVPPGSWVNDPVEGGGRILGEVCHFVDLLQFLASSRLVEVQASGLGAPAASKADEDVVATLKFDDGSLGNIVYTAAGHRTLARERIEVFCQESVCVIENFRRTRFYGAKVPSTLRTWRQDRGHRGELAAWFEALRAGAPAPVSFQEYVAATLGTFAVAEAVRTGRPVQLDLSLLERCEKQAAAGGVRKA